MITVALLAFVTWPFTNHVVEYRDTWVSERAATLCNGFYALVVYIHINLKRNNIEMKCKFQNVLRLTQELLKTSWLMQPNETKYRVRAEKKEQWNITFGETTLFAAAAAFCCLLLQILIIHWINAYTVSSMKQRVAFALSQKINGEISFPAFESAINLLKNL